VTLSHKEIFFLTGNISQGNIFLTKSFVPEQNVFEQEEM